MYVGPWQEYKLMKVIEDLREEQARMRHAGLAYSQHEPTPIRDDDEEAGLSVTSASSGRPAPVQGQQWRLPRSPGVVRLPLRCVAAADVSSAYVHRASAEHESDPFQHFPRGHPFAQSRPGPHADRVIPTSTSAPPPSADVATHPCTVTLPGHAGAEAALLERLLHTSHVALDPPTRTPLVDPAVVGQRAGRRVYERHTRRLVAYAGAEDGDGVGVSTARRRRGTTHGDTDTLQARIERRLRLQALYGGVAFAQPLATDASRDDDAGRSHTPPPPAASPHHVGVPWDYLPPALVHGDAVEERPLEQNDDTDRVATPPQRRVVTVVAPDEVGALLDWAAQLDCTSIDMM